VAQAAERLDEVAHGDRRAALLVERLWRDEQDAHPVRQPSPDVDLAAELRRCALTIKECMLEGNRAGPNPQRTV
jgi:hypothetical protein